MPKHNDNHDEEKKVSKKDNPHIEIKTKGCQTEVFINGTKLDGVRGVGFERKAGKVPLLQIDLIATDMVLDAVMVPSLPEIFQPFYELKKPSEDGFED